uniref:Uncharacterized protein n=1 Tax=Helicotheca tamesis TaxID=374047 RepID=A0A7S2N203_9STRA|mmetsp:Transcript_8160/g.11212  ORF Transcript_8160/g.11212 Transcript_8160/m.11212 type:complete len:246 (+) Transcript_8160:108-845(+)|eukprot:CAMPEP_0185730028 /NCGR_PEP_ID=MMETSP1171-20130828/8147_1 /TAXON_ID=374046 /ORGANISM="Helicotheca tamensis, Strain CCMP826" /LENGTH=245 /DNA_ID=CAMNT_0028399001 /DNA_START=73 /DNA_END=810 /DNA_ORIENTATION=+
MCDETGAETPTDSGTHGEGVSEGQTTHRRSSFLTSSDGAPDTRRRSSLLTRARESLVWRKNKETNAEALRGTSGADFEGYAMVQRGAGGAAGLCTCDCFGGGNETKKIRFLLIKGASCFVFSSEGAPAPKYAISLAHMKAELDPQAHGGRTTVYLKTNLGDIEYTMTFATEISNEVAVTFRDVVNEQSATAQTEEIKKRLGHEHLLNKRASTKFADAVAMQKVKEQPEAPLTAAEMMDVMPAANY